MEDRIMKKSIAILGALLALAACNKEILRTEETIDASSLVFDIRVENTPATKGVKTGWESGDLIYVFLEDNTTQYLRMTYDGTAWNYSDKDGGTAFTGLSLAASGKKLSAVYMPGFVAGAASPSYDTDKWVFPRGGYFLEAEAVDYTVTAESDVNTLKATLRMTAPDNLVQVYINEPKLTRRNDLIGAPIHEYVLNMTNVKPFTFEGMAPGGAAVITEGTANFPLPGYFGTLDGEEGYYFWGILDNTSLGETTYNFQLVEQHPEKKFAFASKSKTVSGTISGPKAIKLSGLSDNGRFVSLGYSGGPLWATGNIGKIWKRDFDTKTNAQIVYPLEAGEYFRYGVLAPYPAVVTPPVYGLYIERELPIQHDVAYSVNTSWRIPTRSQFETLRMTTNADWKDVWAYLGSSSGRDGGVLVTSTSNGISLFFAAAGFMAANMLTQSGDEGYYWSTTMRDDNAANLLFGYPYGYLYLGDSNTGTVGLSVRPVKNL